MSFRAALVAVLLLACTDRGRDEAYVKENILAAEPTPKLAVNADLGGKIVYLGLDAGSPVRPGQPFKLVHYWKVVEPVGSGYRVFTHLEGRPRGRQNGDDTRMRSAYPVADWKAGDIIRDEQTVTLPAAWPSPELVVTVGIYAEDGGSRLDVRSGPSDGQRRVRAAVLQVEGARVPEDEKYLARRVAQPIAVDGKLDPAWEAAPWTRAFQQAEGSPGLRGDARAKLLWDDANLYVLVEAKDRDIRSPFEKHDDPLWKADVVELFIDADGSRRGYVELQASPRSVVFDSWFVGTRAPPGGDPAWQSGLTAAAAVEGSVNGGDSDRGWLVEFAIPHAAVKGADAAMQVPVPPVVGNTWRMNIVRVDVEEAEKRPAASSWSQISYSDFHGIDRLGRLVFADEAGAVPPEPVGRAAGLPGESAPAPAPAPAPRSLKKR